MSTLQPQSQAWIEYDYAIVRAVPRVEIGTFVNIGVVMHARRAGFLEARMHVDRQRIAGVCGRIDIDLLQCFAEAYGRVCLGGAGAGPIGLLPASERFHWLTAPRSAVLQTSPVHPGRCRDLHAALDSLFQEHCMLR